jgi:hypothetical protein
MNDELFNIITQSQQIWKEQYEINRKIYKLNKNREEKKRSKERNKNKFVY